VCVCVYAVQEVVCRFDVRCRLDYKAKQSAGVSAGVSAAREGT